MLAGFRIRSSGLVSCLKRGCVKNRAFMSLEEIADAVRRFSIERNVEKAIVFGSRARGSHTRRSDLDIILVMQTDRRFFDRYEEIAELYVCFKDMDVDILVYTPEELERIAHRPFIKRALTEGKVVYER